MAVEKKEFASQEEFLTNIQRPALKDKLIVVDFSAEWCPPCKRIKPIFEKFSETYTEVVFYAIDVDRSDDLCASLGISSMPTFQFWKNGTKITQFTGADEKALEEQIKNL